MTKVPKKIPVKFTPLRNDKNEGGVMSRPRADGKLVYFIRYGWNGDTVVEKVGLTEKAAWETLALRKQQRDDPETGARWVPPKRKKREERKGERAAKLAEKAAKARTVAGLVAVYKRECAPLKRDQDWQRWTLDAVTREFGTLPLAELMPERIEAWRDKLATEGKSPSTIRKYIYFLSGIYTEAMTTAAGRALMQGLPYENPCRLVKLPDEPEALIKALTAKQASAVLQAAAIDSTVFRWADLILHTGMRVEEAQKLQWEHVEPDWRGKKMIGARFAVHDTKTGKPRFVEAATALVADLSAWWKDAAEKGARPTGPVIGESLKAFPYFRWKHTFERAGVPWGDEREKFTTRNLRTTFCTLAFRNGARPEYLVQQTGHSIRTLLKYYAVASRDQQKLAVNALPNLKRRGLRAVR